MTGFRGGHSLRGELAPAPAPDLDRNLAPGGRLLLADPFRQGSFALLEAMEAEGWKVTMNKWTVGAVSPERAVGVFELTRGSSESVAVVKLRVVRASRVSFTGRRSLG